MEPVVERFLRYVSFDTQSNEHSDSCPSTDKQKRLGAALEAEMEKLKPTPTKGGKKNVSDAE